MFVSLPPPPPHHLFSLFIIPHPRLLNDPLFTPPSYLLSALSFNYFKSVVDFKNYKGEDAIFSPTSKILKSLIQALHVYTSSMGLLRTAGGGIRWEKK